MLTTSQIKSELADDTRRCFTRHEFETWGDALTWMLTEEYDVLEREAGSIGYSQLSTEILWLIALFGPKEKVDRDIIKIRNMVPSSTKISKTSENKEESETEPIVQIPRRRPRKSRRHKRY